MSEISEIARRALLDHCCAVLPDEACGYLVGDSTTGRVDRFEPITNAAASPTRFRFDPHEQLAVEQRVEDAGEHIVGIAHSHPTGEPVPSAVDIADASEFDPFGTLLHVVVAPGSGEIRAFRIVEGEVRPA